MQLLYSVIYVMNYFTKDQVYKFYLEIFYSSHPHLVQHSAFLLTSPSILIGLLKNAHSLQKDFEGLYIAEVASKLIVSLGSL